MAKIHVNGSRNAWNGNAPYGNVSVLRFTLKGGADGTLAGSMPHVAPKADDVLVLGTLPEGFCLEDAAVVVSVPMSSGVTADLGFVYADGKDDAAVPQDEAFFGSGLALGTAKRLRTESVKLAVLPKEALLTMKLKGAANAQKCDVTVLVYGEMTGER